MHFASLFTAVALAASAIANPLAGNEGGQHCVTKYTSVKATVTKTTTITKTAPCPILSIPGLSKIGITGTLVPVRSITSILKRDPEPSPEAAPIDEGAAAVLEERGGKPCTITKQKGTTITKHATTTTTVKRTGCPIVSLRRRRWEDDE